MRMVIYMPSQQARRESIYLLATGDIQSYRHAVCPPVKIIEYKTTRIHLCLLHIHGTPALQSYGLQHIIACKASLASVHPKWSLAPVCVQDILFW